MACLLREGTAQAAKPLLHHLAHEPRQHKSARMNKADGQLEFRSTVCPLRFSPALSQLILHVTTPEQRAALDRLLENEGRWQSILFPSAAVRP